MKIPILIAAAALPFAVPLCAQTAASAEAAHATDPNQPENDGSAAASATVAVGVDPGTSAANAGVAGDIAAVKTANANNRAQYDADLSAYDSAMQAHDRRSARYAQQKRAYADAMAAWRVQVDACNRGKTAACKMPAPDPGAFY